MRRLAVLLACAGVFTSPAQAAVTRLYFQISSGVRTLTPTVSVSTLNCAGGTGCDTIGSGGTGTCTLARALLSSPSVEYAFVVPETWGQDSLASDTNFKYFAKLFNGGFTQPTIQVTYQYNTPGSPTFIETMGPSCPCGVTTGGCPLNSSAGPLVAFDKQLGGNISPVDAFTDQGTLSALQTTLPAGSTVYVDIWVADSAAAPNGTAEFVSNLANPSYIDVPYSKNNFNVFGQITPPYAVPSSVETLTYILTNPASSVALSSLTLNIPGGIQGTTAFYGSVSVVSVSVPRSTTEVVVTQATTSADGSIAIDFTSNPIAPGQNVTVVFTCSTPGAALQGIRWDADVTGPSGSIPVSPLGNNPDAVNVADLYPPGTASSLAATATNTQAAGGALNITWNGPLPFDQAAVTAYQIFRGTVALAGSLTTPLASSPWRPLTNIFNQTVGLSFTDGSLTNGQPFCYTIESVNPVATGLFSAMICGTPYMDPRAPVSITASVSSGKVKLIWNPAVAGTYAITGYEIYRGTCAACGLSLYMTVWDSTAASLVDAGLLNTTTYLYKMRMFDVLGHRSAFTPVVTGSPAVNPPSNVTISYDYALRGVALQWTPSSGNLFNLTGYNVYRSTCATCVQTRLGPAPPLSSTGNPQATVYVDASVSVGTRYFYAMDAASDESAPATTEGQQTARVKIVVPPALPFGLTVVPWPPATLFLQWSETAPGSAQGYSYQIFRSTGPNWSPPQTDNFTYGVTSLTYTDTGLAFGQRYYYRVAAIITVNAPVDTGISPLTPDVFGVMRPDPPTGLAAVSNNSIVRLSWNDLRPGEEVLTYNIYRSTVSAVSGSVFVASVSTTYYDDTFVTNAITYFYSVNATNLGGSGAYASVGGVIPYVPPGNPGLPVASSGILTVGLSWGPSVATSFPVAGYWIYRGTYAGGEGGAPINPFSALITATYYSDGGLADGTTYFYTVAAQDSAGHVSGVSGEAFATPAIPPCPPATLTAVAGNGQVVLQWALVSGTACTVAATLPVSGYRIYRSTVSLALYAPVGSVVSDTTTVYTDLTAVNGTTYYYAVRSFDTGLPPNESVRTSVPFSATFSPETVATPRIPAAAPVGLTILPDVLDPFEHDTELKITWTPSVAGSLPIAGYDVYRSTRVGGPDTLVYLPGAATNSYLDTGLTNKKYYYYRVAPLESGGFEGLWAAVSGTPYADPLPPTGVTAMEADTQMVIQWSAPAATSYPVTAYQISRATYPGIVSLTPLSGPGINPFYGTVFTDTGLADGTTYYYHVQTYDTQMHMSHGYSAEVSGTPYAVPAAPTGLTLASGNTRITVSWNAAAPGTYAISGYIIYRATYTGAPCPGVPIASVAGGVLQYVNAGMPNDGTFYFYKVAAFDVVSAGHLSPCSGEQSASPFATIDPPGKPNNLTAAAGSALVALSWQAGTPAQQPVSGYSIYRTTYAGNPATPVEWLADTVSGTVTTYQDAAAVNGTVYYYRVRTRDDAYTVSGAATSYSQSSNEATAFPAQTPSGIVPTPGVGFISLAWTAVAAPAGPLQCTGYAVYRALAPGGPYAFVGNSLNDRLAAAFTDNGVTDGLTVYYKVLARHEQGWTSALSAVSAGSAALGPPSAPALAGVAGDKVVWLNWTAASGGITPTTSYQIYRATTASGPWAGLGTPQLAPVFTYTDTGGGVANGTPYYYQVAALDSSPPPAASTYSNAVYTLPLGVATSLAATAVSSHINLTWAPSANGTAGISGYLVYRLSPTQAEGVTGTVFGPSASTYFDATALVGVTYTYRVRAFDQITPPTMTGLFSRTVSGTPVSPPAAPVITTLTASFKRIDLVWAPPSPPGGTFPLSGYQLFRASAAGPSVLIASFSSTAFTTYADVGLTNGVIWNYTLAVFDNQVPPNSSVLSNVKGGIPYDVPAPPVALTTQPAGSGKLLVQWSVTVTQVTYPVAGYNLYRGTVTNGENLFAPVNVSLVSTSFYTDTGLVNATTYFYKIRSVDTQGHVSSTSVEVAGAPFNPATPPSGLSALPGNQIVMLAWSATTAGTYPVVGYNVYRGGAYVAGPFNATIYTDSGLVNGTPYSYTVTSVDSLGDESPVSTAAVATPLAALVNPPQSVAYTVGGAGITLTWSGTFAGTQTPTQYVIIRSTCSACGYSTSTYVAAGTFSYTDTQTGSGASITYAIRAVVTANILESADIPGRSVIYIANACSPPGAPGSLVATGGSGAVSLAWSAASSACGVLGYNVYRNGTLLTAVPIANLAYVDSGLANGTTYQYRVTAVSPGGEGTAATASATPALRPNGVYLTRNAVAPVRGERVDIQYTLQDTADVTVRIYTMAGLKVYEATDRGIPAGPPVGSYDFADAQGFPGWDGKASDGAYVASGVYLIDITAGKFHKALKVVVVK